MSGNRECVHLPLVDLSQRLCHAAMLMQRSSLRMSVEDEVRSTSSIRCLILLHSRARRSEGIVEERTKDASADTVLYALVVLSAIVLCTLAIADLFLAVLVPVPAQTVAPYRILLLITDPRSARLDWDGPPMFGISLPIARAECAALLEAVAI